MTTTEQDPAVRRVNGKLYEKLLGKPGSTDGRYPALALYSRPSYNGGVRLCIKTWPEDVHYVYALPWARGWSVFASDRDDETVYSWRDVKPEYKGLQAALDNPRDVVGPEGVPTNAIVDAINNFVGLLTRAGQVRRSKYAEDHWPRMLVWYFYSFNGNNPVGQHDVPYRPTQVYPPDRSTRKWKKWIDENMEERYAVRTAKS